VGSVLLTITSAIGKLIAMENDPRQIDINEALVENARRTAQAAQGAPYLGPEDWSKMVLDLVRIIDELKKKNGDLLEAVQRTAKE
jgi:hypothetical protein